MSKTAPILVRWHASGYAQSMQTIAAVRSQAELDAYFGQPVTIDAAWAVDSRNGWKTHLILDFNKRLVGYSDGELPQTYTLLRRLNVRPLITTFQASAPSGHITFGRDRFRRWSRSPCGFR